MSIVLILYSTGGIGGSWGGYLFSATIVTVLVWGVLVLIALYRLRRVPLETRTIEMSKLIYLAFTAALAITTATTVAAALGASLDLLPPLFEIDMNQVYLVGLVGAAIAVWWSFANFWREMSKTSLIGQGEVVGQTKALSVQETSPREDSDQQVPKQVALRTGLRSWTGGDPAVIAQDWVAARIRPKVVENWFNVEASEDAQGRVVVTGAAVTSSSPLPRSFHVVMTKNGQIIYDESYVSLF